MIAGVLVVLVFFVVFGQLQYIKKALSQAILCRQVCSDLFLCSNPVSPPSSPRNRSGFIGERFSL